MRTRLITISIAVMFAVATVLSGVPSASLALAAASHVKESRAGRVPTQPIETTDQVVVGFEPGKESDAVAAATAAGAKVSRRASAAGFLVVKVPVGQTAASVSARLSGKSGVRFAEPDGIVHALFTPNDTYFPLQVNLAKIGAPAAWDNTQGSPSVTIAIVDSGVDLNHPEFAGRIDTVNDYDFANNDVVAMDDFGHGTHVAGIAAAATNNGQGVAGVAGGCEILPVKVLDSKGSGTDSNVALGIKWAADRGAKVINLSLGGVGWSSVLADAATYAQARDCVIVAATGNQGSNSVFYPAALPGVIGVGSTAADDTLSSFSNRGPGVDITAPGEDIWSTYPSPAYQRMNGTSMATPHVTGAAALVRTLHPELNRTQVENLLEQTALDLGAPGRDDSFGWGRLRLAEALGSATPPPPAADNNADIPGILASKSPLTDTLTVSTDTEDVFKVWVLAGQTITMSLTSPTWNTDFDLFLYGPDATSIQLPTQPLDSSEQGLNVYPEAITYTATTSGWHYMDVWLYDGRGGNPPSASGRYTLTYAITGMSDDDIPGVVAPPGSSIPGSLTIDADVHDVYRIPMVAGESIRATLTAIDPSTDFDLHLFGPSAISVRTDPPLASANSTRYPDTLSYLAPATGTCYLDVHDYRGSSDYNVQITRTPPDPHSVWRFYNMRNGVHFYTANPDERDYVLRVLGGTYRLECIAYSVNVADPDNRTPLYRFFNVKAGVHFYTANPDERDYVLRVLGGTYRFEQTAYNVCATPVPGAAPVYRFFKFRQGVHFYTANYDEMLSVRANLWQTYRFEGATYYIAP